MKITTPLYLLRSRETCYRCGSSAPVVALASRSWTDRENEAIQGEDGQVVLIHDIQALPAEVLRAIHAVHPNFERRHSRMAESTYFMNLCGQCSAHFGDFFLFSEPGGAFFPVDRDEAARIEIVTLDLEGTFELDASYSFGPGEEIFADRTPGDFPRQSVIKQTNHQAAAIHTRASSLK